jgi:hypothetical protein
VAGGLFDNGAKPSVIDVGAFFDSGVPQLCAELLSMGVLVSLGTTRDRGAVSITITTDGAFDREYFRNSSDAEDYLRNAGEALRGMGLGPSRTDLPSVQKPTRRRQKLT